MRGMLLQPFEDTTLWTVTVFTERGCFLSQQLYVSVGRVLTADSLKSTKKRLLGTSSACLHIKSATCFDVNVYAAHAPFCSRCRGTGRYTFVVHANKESGLILPADQVMLCCSVCTFIVDKPFCTNSIYSHSSQKRKFCNLAHEH